MQYDVAIIGGGAAGLMCAIEAGKRGRRVIVLEHNAQIGRKILISGGGRCNFTNLHTTAANFLSQNPHFAKSALARYTPRDFIGLVERHGIAYHEKTLGQLFCDRSARDILRMLQRECDAAGVRIETNSVIRGVTGAFEVDTKERRIAAESLVIASGGLSIPKIGATPFGYRMAKQFGLKIVSHRPALVPLTFSDNDLSKYGGLAGVSAEAVVHAGGAAFREKLLFTHRGLSGPAILQASSYWKRGSPIEIDLLPGLDVMRELQGRGRAEPRTVVTRYVPRRLADVHTPPGDDMEAVSAAFHHWLLTPAGTEGYDKAEVTAGGVDTAELSSKTFEAKKVPRLYFIGEVVDVTGHLGGFNFQWAWASGYSAGQFV